MVNNAYRGIIFLPVIRDSASEPFQTQMYS